MSAQAEVGVPNVGVMGMTAPISPKGVAVSTTDKQEPSVMDKQEQSVADKQEPSVMDKQEQSVADKQEQGVMHKQEQGVMYAKTNPSPTSVMDRQEQGVMGMNAQISQKPPIELALIVNAITTGFKNLVNATTTSGKNLVNSLKNDVTQTINKINTNSILKTMAASIEQINGSMPAPAETNNAVATNNATAGGGTRKAYHRKGLRMKKGKKTLRNRRT